MDDSQTILEELFKLNCLILMNFCYWPHSIEDFQVYENSWSAIYLILSNKTFCSFKMTELIEYTVVSQQDNSNVASRPSLNHVSLEVKMRSLGLGHGRCDVIASFKIFTSCLFLLQEIRDFIPQNNENCLILKSLNVSCWFSSSFYYPACRQGPLNSLQLRESYPSWNFLKLILNYFDCLPFRSHYNDMAASSVEDLSFLKIG